MNTSTTTMICKICGNELDNEYYLAKEMMFGFRDEFEYFQCSKCKCLQINEFPKDISKYYPTNYYSLEESIGIKNGIRRKIKRLSTSASIFNKGLVDKFVKIVLPTRKYQVFKGLDISRETRILDVGCGNGANFLYPLAEIGFKFTLGCDPHIGKPLTYSNGLEILKTDISGIEGKWDIITYHHSFEHIENPVANLEKVRDLLSPSGLCIIRIPTVSSYAWERYKTNWFQLDAPRHYFLHSVESMKYMLNLSGLKLLKVISDSTHKQFTESEKYRNDISLFHPREKGLGVFLVRKVKKYRYVKMTKQLNKEGMGDQAAFYIGKV